MINVQPVVPNLKNTDPVWRLVDNPDRHYKPSEQWTVSVKLCKRRKAGLLAVGLLAIGGLVPACCWFEAPKNNYPLPF